ncbi:Hsp70 family protein [Rhodococcus sp. NPDC054953]
MTTPDWLLSIDFGTSNTAAAHSGATSGRVETLALSHASNLMPSAVHVETPDRIAVGEVAANEATRNPAGYLPAPKRLIGAPTIAVGGFTVPTFLPVAAVLRSVLDRAVAAHAGVPPSGVVLTHPEAWSPEQIQVLADAARHAGIDPARITFISEPRAAAQHYSRSHTLQPGAKIAVFDFGGGTLDVAVLTVDERGGFRVIAARGDNGLGGKNVDALVARWVDRQLDDRDPDLREYLRRGAPIDVRHALDESVRRAKELLSEAPSATITVTGNGTRETLQITRGEFDELIAPTVDRAVHLTRETLLDAGVTAPDQLAALYLTGGTARIPLVHDRLRALGPVATLDDPKTVVAQGALTGLSAAPPRPVPTAADLAPTPREETPAPTRSRRPSRTLLVGAAAVVVIGGAAAIGGMLMRDTGESADAAPTSAQTTGGSAPSGADATSSAPVTNANGDAVAKEVDQVLAAVPTTLRSDLADCENGHLVTDNGGVQVMCSLDESGDLAGLTTPPWNSVTISLDQAEARKDIIGARRGSLEGPNSTLVESIDRMSAADISAPDPADGLVDVTTVNTNTGVRVTVRDVNGVEDAKKFLSRSGLVN